MVSGLAEKESSFFLLFCFSPNKLVPPLKQSEPYPPLLFSVILGSMSCATREGALQLYAVLHETLQLLYKIVNS